MLAALPFFSLIVPRPPRSTLFPYTTLFRSLGDQHPQVRRPSFRPVRPGGPRLPDSAGGGLPRCRSGCRTECDHLRRDRCLPSHLPAPGAPEVLTLSPAPTAPATQAAASGAGLTVL